MVACRCVDIMSTIITKITSSLVLHPILLAILCNIIEHSLLSHCILYLIQSSIKFMLISEPHCILYLILSSIKCTLISEPWGNVIPLQKNLYNANEVTNWYLEYLHFLVYKCILQVRTARKYSETITSNCLYNQI